MALVPPGARTDVLVVSFMHLRPRPGLEDAGFGESYLWRLGVAAVHVQGAANDWFLHAEIPALLAAIRAFREAQGYARLVTYGFSMGAYAAVNLAPALGSTEALALMPQATLDARKAPLERHWRRAARGLPLEQDRLGERDGTTTCVVLFDPGYARDLAHLRLLERSRRVVRVPLRFLRHAAPPPAVMQAALRAVLDRAPDPGAEARRLWRAERGALAAAWWAAALQSGWRRRAWALAWRALVGR